MFGENSKGNTGMNRYPTELVKKTIKTFICERKKKFEKDKCKTSLTQLFSLSRVSF